MAVIFAGTSLIDFINLVQASAQTSAANKSPDVAECVRFSGGSSRGEIPLGGVQYDEFWLGWTSFMQYGNNSKHAFAILDSAGDPIFIFQHASGTAGTTGLIWNGSAYVKIGNVFRDNTRNRIDIHYKRGTTDGVIEVWQDGVKWLNFVGNTDTRSSAPASILFASPGSNGDNYQYISAVVMADEDTRTMRVTQLLPNAAGSETAWTGDYTAIDEVGYNDTDFIEGLAAGDVETWGNADIGAGYGAYDIEAVIVGYRAEGTGSPANVAAVAKIGGTIYEQAASDPTPSVFGVQRAVFPVNPATGLPWTVADFNGAEFGVKATA